MPEVHRSERIRHEPERYQGFLVTNCNDVMIVYSDEPANYEEAMMNPDSENG